MFLAIWQKKDHTAVMRVSSVDVGSNAIRLVIVEIKPNGQWEQVKKFRAPLRLGTDVFKHRQLQPDTILELVDVFKKIAKLNKKHKVQKTIALATSAMRDAKNKKSVISLVKKTSKIDLKIITGQEEARLIRDAIIKSKSNHFSHSLLIDLGGGSAEITGLLKTKVLFSKSYPLGVVRLLSVVQQKKDLNKYCEKYLSKLKPVSKKYTFSVAVGTGGNFDALAKLKLNLLKEAPQTHMSLKQLLEIQKHWAKLSHQKKLALGLREDRIDVLPIAIQLILMILKQFKIQHLKIPMTGLKEGSIHDLL